MSNEIIRSDAIDLSGLNIQETSFSLSEFKQIVYRRWKPALAVGITVFTGLFLLTALKTPEYRSETLILLENPQNQESATVAPQQTTGSQYYSMTDLSTEIYVLRSNSMIAKAVETLKDRYPEISVGEIVSKISIHQAVNNKVPTDVLAVSYVDPDPEKAKAVLEALGSTYIDYSLEKQRSQASNAIKFIDSQLPHAQKKLDEAAKEIRHFRQVHQLVDPEVSAMTAGEEKQSIALEIQQTQIAIDLNRKQREELEYQLKELGQDSETMLASSVLAEDGVYQNLANKLREIETQYNLGTVDFRDNFHVMGNLQEKRKELKKQLQKRAEQVLGKSISPEILERIVLTPSYTDVRVSADSAGESGGSESGSSESINNQTTNSSGGDRQISSEGSTLGLLATRKLDLENQASSLQSQLASLRREKAAADNKFISIPGLQQTFTELKRQVELKSESYNYLLERRQELEISEAEETAPWRVLNAPFLPGDPISPNIKQGLIQALMAGGFLGLATAFILQQLDQSVKQVEEIKQITKLPLLGVIPKVGDPRIEANIHTTRQSYSYYSSFTEGLRSLAMNLRYLMADDGQIKSLAITSSTSAEGKSTISYNLGIVLAELGQRVLVVDADLRKPKLHKLAQIKNESGLSEAITTDNLWTEYLRPSSIDNLDLITAGTTSPNPIALLNSDKMKQLIEDWEAGYDYIIIDTPPIGVIADAKSLANEVDSMLFISGIQRASRKSISNALDVLRQSQCNVAGVVANMVDPEFDYYAYSYYDSYYNQSGKNNDDSDSDTEDRRKGILQQFRRR
ncbi:polysaccharide biosynthesis tyrosine autokinase [Waterburya agarophytonicola K14]|uniref:non-specific protein-tyrosine kinase n=1 Tax=Waterburya agarophytonicola KI4 TaxID=2874699 RepID=A0A964BRH6_9CYAN|nr:polysaccharide biosynthesis tyrosine autokinase [Waterburya agarophytonicola]MCC0176480.1 polysaccharide biosynthesis tyrosine autokinase [Waterburya agarophytonicola KI4]